MRSQFERGCCPFCHIDTQINSVLFSNTNWLVWENAFKNDRQCEVMLVIVSRKHIRGLEEITPSAWVDLSNVLSTVEKQFPLLGGMLFIRFGDMRLNAGTVPHLHFNLWVPNGQGEVRVPIYKNFTESERNRVRAVAFAKQYEAGEKP